MSRQAAPPVYANNPTSPLPSSVPIPRVGRVAASQPTGYDGKIWPAQTQQNQEVPVRLNINGKTVTNGKQNGPSC
jgi:hypothetical protein